MHPKTGQYDPKSSTPFKISITKIESFLTCPRCFYLHMRFGLTRPPLPAQTLNFRVDQLLKREFDIHREKQSKHEVMTRYEIKAVPIQHPDLEIWRDDVRKYMGASVLHKKTNFIVHGIVDDVWINTKGEMIIVDYRSTGKPKEVSQDMKFSESYRRRMDLYQWIFNENGYKVSDTGYFLFANPNLNKKSLNLNLEFELTLISHKTNTSWIVPTLARLKACLDKDRLPSLNTPPCPYCQYRENGSITDLVKSDEVENIIAKGESSMCEFKSSMRWDYKLNRVGQYLEKPIAKSIAGLMNTKGGILLIGVDDSGLVLGIEKDFLTLGKRNADAFELALTNVINKHLGKNIRSEIKLDFLKLHGKTILQISVPEMKEPVYYQDGDTTNFFIRLGNSTQELNIKEATKYIQLHRPEVKV